MTEIRAGLSVGRAAGQQVNTCAGHEGQGKELLLHGGLSIGCGGMDAAASLPVLKRGDYYHRQTLGALCKHEYGSSQGHFAQEPALSAGFVDFLCAASRPATLPRMPPSRPESRSESHDRPQPPLGKLGPEAFERLIGSRLGASRPEVLVGPRLGHDGAIVKVGAGRVMAVTTDPLSLVPALGAAES